MNKKNILIVLGIIIILIAGYILINDDPKVSEQLGGIETELAECQSRLATWQTEYGDEEPRSEMGQDALDKILDECKDTVDKAEDTI